MFITVFPFFVHFFFLLIYLCRVAYVAKEADFYTALPKQNLDDLITVIYKKDEITLRTIHNNTLETKTLESNEVKESIPYLFCKSF